MRVVMQDGELRADARVSLDVEDQGLTTGLSAFETLRSYRQRFPHRHLHVDRLSASAAALGLEMPAPALLLAEIAQVLAVACSATDAELVLRITLTGHSRILRVGVLPAQPTSLRVATRQQPWQPWLSGRVKHGSRAQAALAVRQAAVDEVLWTDSQGALLEGTWSNVCAVRQGVWITPPDDGRILSGITRRLLLDAAVDSGLPHLEGQLQPSDHCDELYCSSSLKGLCAIVELDGRPAPGWGPIGRRLLAAMQSALRSDGR